MDRISFVTPRVLGIDEVHLNNAYYGVFVNVDRQNGGIIELSEERSKNAVIDVLKRLENPENLCYVTMDMWRPYYDAVQSVFPGIPVIIDHFHVIKELSRSLDSIRAGLCKSIKDTKTRVSLKHNRFLLLKSSEELTPTQNEHWMCFLPLILNLIYHINSKSHFATYTLLPRPKARR